MTGADKIITRKIAGWVALIGARRWHRRHRLERALKRPSAGTKK
jgi:hypothetical protein